MKKTPRAAAPQPGFQMYTLEQIAQMTGWSLSHLRRSIRSGRLMSYKLGRSVRISEPHLRTFLKSVERGRG
jgi:excisionase family DNA binding protein